MIHDWKFKVRLDDCEVINDYPCEEETLVFVPRKGEIFWMTEQCMESLDNELKSCWRRNHCDDCPYIYRSRRSESDLSSSDANIVSGILYDVESKTIFIDLKKDL